MVFGKLFHLNSSFFREEVAYAKRSNKDKIREETDLIRSKRSAKKSNKQKPKIPKIAKDWDLDSRPWCWTDWRWDGGVLLATVRPTNRINSLAAGLWKNPKWLTSVALASTNGSGPSDDDEEESPAPTHLRTSSAVTFIWKKMKRRKRNRA